MFPYLLILFFTIIVFISHSFCNERENRITGILWCFVMSVFVGFQDGIGVDSSTYRSWAYMESGGFHDVSAMGVVYLVNYYHLPDFFIFFIYTFVAYFFLTLFLLQYPKDYRVIGALLLFSNIYFIQSFNIIRQIAAASVFIYGVSLFIKGNKYSYVFLAFSALIHLTALLGIIMLFVSRFLKLGKPLFVVYIASIFIFLMGGVVQHLKSLTAILAVYDDHYEYLTDKEVNVYAGVGLQYLLTLSYGMFLYFQRKNPLLLKYQKTVLVTFVGLILYNLLASDITFFRMSYYFYFFIYVSVPLLIEVLDKKNRHAIAIGLSLVYVFQFVVLISSNKNFFPYKNVLF